MTKPRAKAGTSETPEAAHAETGEETQLPFSYFPQNAQAANAVRMGAAAMEHWVATGQEMARFYTRRLKKDMETMSAFAACRTPEQFNEVWYKAASETVHDYAEEFDKVMAINLNGSAAER